MANNRQIAWNKKTAPYVTAALALEVVSLFGFAYLTDSHVPGISPLAATAIFIDGSKDIIPSNDSQAADRMRNTLDGAYDQCGAHSTGPCANNVYIQYSSSTRGDFGILTDGVGYNQSTQEATNKTIAAIIAAQSQNPNDPIYVVGYSQGAAASSDVIKQAQALNLDLSNVTFVMLGSPARNDGGIFARLGPGVYVPFLGVSFGQSTNPTTGPNAPGQVIMITKQYDGSGDVPKYMLLNPLAALNSAMGFYYVHQLGYYSDVTFDPKAYDVNNNGKLDPSEIATINADPQGRYIVTSNGNVVDVLVKNQPGDLPLTQPLKDLGVPDDVIKAIDPLLRAMIDASYQRPTNGVYPSQPVHFGLIPKPDKMFQDFLAIEAGADQTGQNLGALNPLQAAAPSLGNALAKQGDVVTPDAPPPGPPAPPKPVIKEHQWPTFQLQQWVPPATQQAPQPPAEAKITAAAVDETPPETQQDPIVPQGNAAGATHTTPSGPIGGSPSLPGLKNVVTSINGVVTGTVTAIQNALTPKPKTSPAPASTPNTDTGAGTGTGGNAGAAP